LFSFKRVFFLSTLKVVVLLCKPQTHKALKSHNTLTATPTSAANAKRSTRAQEDNEQAQQKQHNEQAQQKQNVNREKHTKRNET